MPCLIQLHWLLIQDNSASWCTASKWESLHIVWLKSCRAAYHNQSSTFWSVFSLRHNELHHTDAAYQVQRACVLFRWSSMWNSLPDDLLTVLETQTLRTYSNFMSSDWLLTLYRISLLPNFYILSFFSSDFICFSMHAYILGLFSDEHVLTPSL